MSIPRIFFLACLTLGYTVCLAAPQDQRPPQSQLEFNSAELLRWGHVARMTPIEGKAPLEARVAPGVKGAFYQQELQWDAASLSQIEFSLKTDAPGYFSFAASILQDNQRSSLSIAPLAAIPDGEYHDYIFEFPERNPPQGILTNYEISWNGGEPATLGWSSVRAKQTRNRLPNASGLIPHQPILLAKLMPRSQCRLAWAGGSSPGVTIRFYDKDILEIPGTAVHLPSGKQELSFTVPEYAIEAYLELEARAEGEPVVQQIRYTPPSAPGNLFWRGNWLWMQNAPGPINRNIWFQREIDLEEVPEFAVMAALGDDSCFTYVNGAFLGKTTRWSQANRYDITHLLKKGRNRISCRVKNIDSWGGFLADVYIKLPKRELFADSDASWLCETQSNTDTSIPTATEQVTVLGDARIAPWRGGMTFRYAGPQGELLPVTIENGRLTVQIVRLPQQLVHKLRFVLVNEQGAKSDFMLPVTPDSSGWKTGEKVTLTFPIPYVDKGISRLFLEDDLVCLKGNPVLATIDKSDMVPPPLRKAQWVGGARPMLQLGEERLLPVFWHAPNVYGTDHLRGITHFADNNFRSYRISAAFQDFWQPDGSFDFSTFDRDVSTLLTLVPNAVFAVHLYSFMPEWWLERNPDDLSRHYNGNPRDLWLDKQALASEKWLVEGETPLKALIDHIKASGFADRVWGMSFTENNCGEWFWSSADANKKRSYAGYSKADYASFRAFLRNRYPSNARLAQAWHEPGLTFDTIQMPYLEDARKGTVGTLLDARQDRKMLDFFEFRSLTLAKDIIHFGRFTKEQTDGKWLTGAYYGYFAEMIANPRRNIQSNGHNGFIETAQSPYVDFVHAPLRYTVRKTGQPGTMMQIWDTYLLHGKMVFVEQDVRTSLTTRQAPPSDVIYCGTPSAPFYDIGQFYRSFGMTATTGALNYWYDLKSSEFDEKALNTAISELNDIYLHLSPVRGTTPCEVAVVSDRDSAYYTQFPSADNPMTIAYEAVFRHFNETAVPFKSLTISDLLDSSIDVQPFRFYVMLPAIMLSRETRAALLERFEREGATVVWLYAAGATYPDQGPSADFCADFLGLKTRMEMSETTPAMTMLPEYGSWACESSHATSPNFYPVSGFDAAIGKNAAGEALMVTKRLGSSMHYFTTLTNLPTGLWTTLLEKAGVWRYSAQNSTRDQFWIGNDLVFLHSVTNGDKSLHLPEHHHARAIVGPFKGTLENGAPFATRSGMTYGFILE